MQGELIIFPLLSTHEARNKGASLSLTNEQAYRSPSTTASSWLGLGFVGLLCRRKLLQMWWWAMIAFHFLQSTVSPSLICERVLQPTLERVVRFCHQEALGDDAATAPTQFEATPIVSSEAAALLALRGMLGIRSRYWPRKADPCQVWSGITCRNGHVYAITLSRLRRTSSGALHPSFALDPLRNLSSLSIFNSSGFALPGMIPDWFGSLPSLEQLDFSSSSIKSSLPTSLGNLVNLQILAIAKNNLTGSIPTSFGNLTDLTSLDLSSNKLTGVLPETLINLRNLVTLNLGANQLEGQLPSGIASFLNLQFLQLGNNAFQGPIPAEYGNLTSLRSLDLGFNALSGSIPISFGKLTSLVSLTLSNNSLNGGVPEQLSSCTHLQSLSLDRNALTGSLPNFLGSLANLSTISLFSNNLSGLLPEELMGLTGAQHILLSNNLFYGTIPSSFTNLSKSATLDLFENYLEGTPPALFVSEVRLKGNCLTDMPNQRSLNVCQNFYLSRGLLFQGQIEAPSPALPLAVDSVINKSNHLAPILGGVFGGVGFVILVMLVMFYVLKRQKKVKKEQGESLPAARKGVPQAFSGNISVNLLCLGENFSYTQLQIATGDFNEANFLKAGHSGDLFQGLLEGHIPVVVKRIDLSRFKKDGYISELDLFGRASHTRLVPLLGHCLEREEEKLLVYEFMPGRDLGHALQKKSRGSSPEDGLQSLDWITRLKIAIGVAEGLTHLHHECTPALVHRDIQSNSIFLDDKFEVRLGSLSEACVATSEAHHGVIARLLRRSQTSEHGEAGATAPTCAQDVYCFGKVLLELVTGKLGISGSTDPSTDAWLEWALSFINVNDKEPIGKIVDPSLIVDEDLMDEVWAMSIVAKSCLNPKPSKRPLMRYILKALENPLKVVREDTTAGSARLRTSSHGSWNGAFFGSWRHSSSETVIIPGSLREEYLHKNKHALNGASQGSGGLVEICLSQRRPGSSEIFPEPLEDSIIQAPTNRDSDKLST
ncbi:hypothetical protein GOP47_0000461 [Adiantum capillus-veneris]|uniref:Protein kinase domain-containing protein n=1 Tax=Adiantum capillus-veneris TaxID=13818 RepID=A0A9D4ZSX3_ADICA|nr:hypothetical protein GOP47_0000461 [Adiantum capillus-veneris]